MTFDSSQLILTFVKKIKLLSILIASLFVISCRNTKDNQAYEQLRQQNLSGDELLVQLVDFEMQHSNHFESKVDLASFYALIGDYPKAYEYCIRAESVIKNAPHDKNGKKAVCILNGTRAKVEYMRGDFDSAVEFCNAAIKDKDNGSIFKFLKGQILISMNKLDDALSVFDEAYKENPDNAANDDLKSYMYLLAGHERFDEAKVILNKYFESGVYFSELGAFASTVYEKTGDIDLSLMSTFYDFLFYAGFEPSVLVSYPANIQKIRETAKAKGLSSDYESALNFLESFFTLDESVKYESDFFIAKYISIAKRTARKTVTKDDIQQLLKMEKHFSIFPIFYYQVYNALTVAEPKALDITAVLEKIISLNNGNSYVSFAKKQLGSRLGLSEQDSQKILVAAEVDKIVNNYKKSASMDDLAPLFDLLEMPENNYELQTLVYLKMEYKNLGLESAFLKKRELCSNKLGERIDYILN